MIKKGSPGLQTMGHGHSIQNHIGMVGHPGHGVHIQHFIDKLSGIIGIKVLCQTDLRIKKAHLTTKCIRIKILFIFIGKIKITQALGITQSSFAKRHLVHPFKLMTNTAIPEPIGKNIDQVAQNVLTQGLRKKCVIAGIYIAIVSVITAKKLISSVPTQHNFNLFARHFRNSKHTNRQRVGWLVKMIHQIRQ